MSPVPLVFHTVVTVGLRYLYDLKLQSKSNLQQLLQRKCLNKNVTKCLFKLRKFTTEDNINQIIDGGQKDAVIRRANIKNSCRSDLQSEFHIIVQSIKFKLEGWLKSWCVRTAPNQPILTPFQI